MSPSSLPANLLKKDFFGDGYPRPLDRGNGLSVGVDNRNWPLDTTEAVLSDERIVQ